MKQLRFALPSRCPRRLRDARSGAASRAGRHWLSDPDSPFGPRPNYVTLFQPCRSVAGRFGALFAGLLLAVSGAAQAKSITALTPSFSDVSKAIGSAVGGDTVIIPAGKASWTRQLVISKAITLIGRTTTNSVAGTAVDSTIIVNNLPTTQTVSPIRVTSASGNSYRISGLSFQDARTVVTQNGYIALTGQSQAVRLDHCHFTPMPYQSVYVNVVDGVYGVADHNVFEVKNSKTVQFHN